MDAQRQNTVMNIQLKPRWTAPLKSHNSPAKSPIKDADKIFSPIAKMIAIGKRIKHLAPPISGKRPDTF